MIDAPSFDRLLSAASSRALAPSAPSPIISWLESNYYLDPTQTRQPGWFSFAGFDYNLGIARAFQDPDVRRIDYMKAAQCGWTTLMCGVMLYSVAVLKMAMLVAYHDEPSAHDFNANKFLTAAAHCPPIKPFLENKRQTTMDRSIRLGGIVIHYGWATSAGTLNMHSKPIVIGDETSKWAEYDSRMKNLDSRTRQFSAVSKKLFGSTPHDRVSKINKDYDLSDRRRFFVPCPSCGQFMRLTFDNLGWSDAKGKGGVRGVDFREVMHRAWITCRSPFCGAKIMPEYRAWMIRQGVWVPAGLELKSDGSITKTRGVSDAPSLSRLDERELSIRSSRDAAIARSVGVRLEGKAVWSDHAGFQINSLYSLQTPPGKLAAEFVKAKGKPGPEWWREEFGEGFAESGVSADLGALLRASEAGGHKLGTVPHWCLVLTWAADIQKDYTVIEVRGWGKMPGSDALRAAVVWVQKIPAKIDGNLSELRTGENDVARWSWPRVFPHGAKPYADRLPDRLWPLWFACDIGHRPREALAFLAGLRQARGFGHGASNVYPMVGESKPMGPMAFRLSRGRTSEGGPLARSGLTACRVNKLVINETVIEWLNRSGIGIDGSGGDGLGSEGSGGEPPLVLPSDLEVRAPWYLHELTSEEKVVVANKVRWQPKPGRAGKNHAFDIAGMQHCLIEVVELASALQVASQRKDPSGQGWAEAIYRLYPMPGVDFAKKSEIAQKAQVSSNDLLAHALTNRPHSG